MSTTNLVTDKYYLNIRSGYMAPVTLHCSYGDSGHSITFYVFDGASTLDLNGSIVAVHGTRKDGANFGPFACTPSGNSVTFKLQSSMTAVEGGGVAEFTITKNSETIGTCNFAIMVEKATFPNGVAYDTDPSVYEDILKYVQTIPSQITSEYLSKLIEETNARKAADEAEKKDRIAGDTTNSSAIDVQAKRIDNYLSSGTAATDSELVDIRVGDDSITYASAGNAVRGQFDDVKNAIYGTTPVAMYSHAANTSNFTEFLSDSIYYKRILFRKGYIKEIHFHRTQKATDDGFIKVFFCDSNLKILDQAVGYDESLNPVLTVNKYIDSDFILAFRCHYNYYGHVELTSSPRCRGLSWGDYGYSRNGSTFPVSEVSDSINFKIEVLYDSVENHVNQVDKKLEPSYSVRQFDPSFYEFDYTTHGSSLGDSINGTEFLHPAGYVKSITLLYKTASTEQIMVWFVDQSFTILRKVYDFGENRTGNKEVLVDYYFDVPFYVFVRAPGTIWGVANHSSDIRNRWDGAWGTYGWNIEGEKLFDGNWNVRDSVWLGITVNYSAEEKNEKTNQRYNRLYTLHDAYRSWLFSSTEKFPILVLGDSTTDADTTSGATANVIGTDHQDPNSYTTKLQQNLRSALNNTALRIYNAGFSGKNALWALQNLNDIVWNNHYYSDLKIMIISHGINDYATYKNAFFAYRYALRQIVLECFKHGVQPVMMTTQAGTENHGRFGWMQMSLADKETLEIAKEYNLEVIDKNAYTAFFNVYSSYNMRSIIPDGCHYSDVGHNFVAGCMFKELVPFTVTAGEGTTILSFADERLRTDLEFSSFSGYIWKDVKVITPANGFKLEARCSKDSAVKLMDFWVFIHAKNAKRLMSYCTTPNVQSVVVDGTSYSVTSSEQEIATLDLGLHHIVVNSAANSNVNYLGLKLMD